MRFLKTNHRLIYGGLNHPPSPRDTRGRALWTPRIFPRCARLGRSFKNVTVFGYVMLKEKKCYKMASQQNEDWSEIENLEDLRQAKKFRLKNRFLLLTYKTHLNKETLANCFKEQFGVKTFNICHENGDKALPYEHTHCVIDFGKSFETTDCRCFDVNEEIHPHIKKLTYRKAYLDGIRYIRKEDKNVIIEETDLVLNIYDDNEGLDEIEILKKCTKFAEVPGALALAKHTKRRVCKIPNIKLYVWQQRIIDLMPIPPDRKIWWFFDPVGGSGKSVFSKWLSLTYPDDVLVLQQLGGMKDCGTIIDGATNWTGKMLIVDLPRAAETREIYAPLECIKNGMLNTIKYAGKPLMWDAGHVIVFANFKPRLEGTWSEDRFHVVHYMEHVNDYVGIEDRVVRFAPGALH